MRPPMQSWPAAGEPPQPHDAPFILVVDDEYSVRSVVSRALARQGYPVAMAADCGEALELLGRGLRVGLILLDIQMPGLNGLEALPYIKRMVPGVPVMLVSGHVEDDSALGVLRTGADGLIPKPFELDVLTAAAERMIERRRLSGAATLVA